MTPQLITCEQCPSAAQFHYLWRGHDLSQHLQVPVESQEPYVSPEFKFRLE